MQPDPVDLLEPVKKIAQQAGQAILKIYNSGEFELCQKDDESPVTSADYAANDVLVAGLTQLTPDIPIISEETPAEKLSLRKSYQRYWLLDPMDGTQEFVSRSGDFAVNIALVENGWPVMGVIYWPTKDITYYAMAGKGAFKQDQNATRSISVRAIEEPENTAIKVAVSRVQKHDTITRYLNSSKQYDLVPLGSASLKSCIIAEGLADCYLRIGPTGEWDTGASHCIIEEAGGKILDSEFNELSYNQRDTLANPDFIVLGNQSIDWRNVIKPHKTNRKLL